MLGVGKVKAARVSSVAEGFFFGKYILNWLLVHGVHKQTKTWGGNHMEPPCGKVEKKNQ